MHFVRINGIVLHYRVAGSDDAPALVLANSLGTDARIWDRVIAQLVGRYRIISYDKRGHGLSDAPPAPYTLADHIGDLAGLVDHLRLESFALAGVSVGGLIAMGFAIAHPERLKALVICDSAPKVGTAEMWNARIAAAAGPGIKSISDAVLERWFSPAFRQGNPVELAGWKNLLERTPVAGYAGTCAALRDADLRAEIGSITLKTLVVVGSEDTSTPPDLVRQTAAALPDARFVVIDGGGHVPMIDRPDELTHAMAHYFNEVGYV
jgi:3-oxoadipate enol-lactonase